MKRIVKIMNILLVLVFVLSSKSVYADSYKMMELIPKDKKVTIRGNQRWKYCYRANKKYY